MSNPSLSPLTLGALLGLTFVTGLVDAASVLGLGHVFVANMTGNIVFLGFSLSHQGSMSLQAGGLALVGFMGGALFGGRSMRDLPGGLRRALLFDVGLLTLGACFAVSTRVDIRWLVLLLGTAMGCRTAIVRALAIPDLTTTVLSLTIAGIAADSTLAGGDNPRFGRRLASVAFMLAGSATGALLFWKAPAYILLVAAILEACGAYSLAKSLSASTRDALGSIG